MGRLPLRPAGFHGLPPELQRNELQLRASVSARCLASLIHRTALSDSQVSRTVSFSVLLRLHLLSVESIKPSKSKPSLFMNLLLYV